jgi:hypothetical protein
MASGGRREGAGRKKGTKNRATVEREINAAAAIDRARREGRELAVDALERFMKIAEGAAGVNKPTTQAEMAAGAQPNPDGDWPRFGEWFDRMVYCAKELAKYQSPQIRAVDLPAPPPDPTKQAEGSVVRFKLRVFEGGRSLNPDAA